MKSVVNLEGNEIEVEDHIPVKTVNGVHYLHSADEEIEYQQRVQSHIENEPKRKDELIRSKRRQEYGTAEQQLEFIAEYGIDAWLERVRSIKKKYPKENENG